MNRRKSMWGEKWMRGENVECKWEWDERMENMEMGRK